MSDSNKDYVANLYDKSKGTARYTSESGPTLRSSSDIYIYAYTVDVAADSTYKYKEIHFTGNTYANSNDIYGSALGMGIAWSNNWGYVSSETTAHWKHKNFWGSVINEYEDGIIDAYTPQVGISFKYEDLHSNAYGLSMNGYVKLRISKTSSGTTDFSAKFGYSEDDVAWSATISAPPAISFSPTTSIYQRAYPGSFTY